MKSLHNHFIAAPFTLGIAGNVSSQTPGKFTTLLFKLRIIGKLFLTLSSFGDNGRPPNNRLQRTALDAAAEPVRYCYLVPFREVDVGG